MLISAPGSSCCWRHTTGHGSCQTQELQPLVFSPWLNSTCRNLLLPRREESPRITLSLRGEQQAALPAGIAPQPENPKGCAAAGKPIPAALPWSKPGRAGALPVLVLHRVEVLPLHSQEQRVSGERSQDHTLSQAATPELLGLPGSLI